MKIPNIKLKLKSKALSTVIAKLTQMVMYSTHLIAQQILTGLYIE
jgi:hypothetical protein